jgi:hypothetical protein
MILPFLSRIDLVTSFIKKDPVKGYDFFNLNRSDRKSDEKSESKVTLSNCQNLVAIRKLIICPVELRFIVFMAYCTSDYAA